MVYLAHSLYILYNAIIMRSSAYNHLRFMASGLVLVFNQVSMGGGNGTRILIFSTARRQWSRPQVPFTQLWFQSIPPVVLRFLTDHVRVDQMPQGGPSMWAVPGLLYLTHVSDLRMIIQHLSRAEERKKEWYVETDQSSHISLTQSSAHHHTRSTSTGGKHCSYLKRENNLKVFFVHK